MWSPREIRDTIQPVAPDSPLRPSVRACPRLQRSLRSTIRERSRNGISSIRSDIAVALIAFWIWRSSSPIETERRQQIPSKETAASDVDRGILCAGAVEILAMLQVSCVMENNGCDGQVPIPLCQRRDNRIAPVRSQQFGDRGGCLHCMVKVMKCRIAWLKSSGCVHGKVRTKT